MLASNRCQANAKNQKSYNYSISQIEAGGKLPLRFS
jgi:hypothetical protein